MKSSGGFLEGRAKTRPLCPFAGSDDGDTPELEFWGHEVEEGRLIS